MPKANKLLRIGELATRSDKTARALHLYEEMGLLEPAQRSSGGFRLYDEANIERIEYIDALQSSGLSLTNVAQLLKSWEGQARPVEAMAWLEERYQERLKAVRDQIAELTALEAELKKSLSFLAGCGGCAHDALPHEICGGCMRNERKKEDLSPLVLGLTAH